MTHIPVALATDNNYIPVVVALTALLRKADRHTFYDIYILIDDSFLQESQQSVERCLGGYDVQFSLTFKNVGDIFDNAPSKHVHITRPTFYRLALPGLLSEDKCIYLDTDTIVMSDLRELYNVSMDDCYVAGVRHPGFILSEQKEDICRKACIPNIDQYINAGIMVMNLKKMRKDNMVSKFLALIPKNMPTMDQDIINSACYGKIVFIPFKYNVMTQCADWSVEDYKGIYLESELKEAWNKPCIIHYASPSKPWNDINCVFMDYWWNMYRKISALEVTIYNLFKELPINAIYHSKGPMFTKRMPKIFDITFKRRYVVYGAGKRARELIAYMKQISVAPEFIVVSNISKNPLEIEGIEVRNINGPNKMLYDKTIIIATKESFHKEIIRNLQKYDYQELLPISDNWNI